MKTHAYELRVLAIRLLVIILSCAIGILALPLPSQADDQLHGRTHDMSQIDRNRPCSLTAHYHDPHTTQPLPQTTLRLYRIAELESHYPALDAYKEILEKAGWTDFNADPTAHNASAWERMAGTLADLLTAQDAQPTQRATTDNEGSAYLPDLSAGIYLIITDSVYNESTQRRYTIQPTLVSLPQPNPSYTGESSPTTDEEQAEAYIYDLTLTPKINVEPVGEPVTYRVTKHWNDVINPTYRPREIIIDILRDGQIYATQTLNENNRWTYSWETTKNRHHWTVAERTTNQYYTVTNDKRGATFIITNTLKPTVPPELATTGLAAHFLPLVLLSGCVGLCALVIRKKRKEVTR